MTAGDPAATGAAPQDPLFAHMEYRREVDGLRALAVLPVLFFHAGFAEPSGGFAGVDVFFVISGYLITSIILTEQQAGQFSLWRFYERRARRILPALFTVMALCLPFAWYWLPPHDLEEFSQSLVAVSTFTSNLYFWRTTGYFETAAELKPLLHTWSLSVEEQFYLLFPAFLMVAWRWGRKRTLWALVLIAMLSLTLAHLGSQPRALLPAGWLPHAILDTLPAASFFLLPTRAWELLLGSLVAFRLSGAPGLVTTPRLVREVLSLLGLVAIVYALLAFDGRTPFPGLHALVPTLGTALILLNARADTWVGRLLGQPALVGIGLISYSAYLWHQPLMALARHRSPQEPGVLLLLALVGASLLLAWLTWRFVERPFRDRQRISSRRIAGYAVAGSLWFAALGLSGMMGQGFAERFDFQQAHGGDVGHMDFHRYVAEQFHTCSEQEMAESALRVERYPRCAQSKAHAQVQVALVGDSHAEHLFLGLAEQMDRRNLAFYIRDSYALLGNPEFEPIFRHVLHSPTIDTVLLTMRWIARERQIPAPHSLEQALGATVKALLAAGKAVYLIVDVPKFPFQAERCKYVPQGTGRPLCEIEAERIHDYERRYLPALLKVAQDHPQVRLVELRELFCDRLRCSMTRDGTILYRDNNHLNIPGSQYVGRQLLTRFPELNR